MTSKLTYHEAWQKAQDAWEAAGKTIPCYEPKYMAARKVLADIIERGKRRAKIGSIHAP